MKLYTKTGDKGKSSLLSGERVPKNDLRIKAYGDVDELNSVIGALVAALPETAGRVCGQLQRIQSDLFTIGAWLATTPGSPACDQLTPVTGDDVLRLEAYIDSLQDELPELKAFILPGGHMSAAWAHVARTVCRRAERHAIDLVNRCGDCDDGGAYLATILVYLNRLSDYLFAAARSCNQAAGVTDVLWQE